jgi:hypothetical protein
VIHHFSETISGVMTIRSLRKQKAFSQENIDRVNASLRMDFHNNGANEWLGFRLDYMGVVFLCIATLFMIFLPSAIVKPGRIIFTFTAMINHYFRPMKHRHRHGHIDKI